MLNKQFIERYIFLIIGLEFMTIGVVFTIHADLGVTPITVPPYVLSLGLKPTVGEFTIAMHIIFVLLQIIILGKNYEKLQLLQLPLGIIFGLFIDINNYFFGKYYPENYLIRIIFVIVGSFFLGVGINIEVCVRTVVVAGEGLVLAIVDAFRLPFGKTKVYFDISLISIGTIFSLMLFREIKAVREGTLISALLVGFFAGKISPLIKPGIRKFLFRGFPEDKIREEGFDNNLFIEENNFNNLNSNIKENFLNKQ